ncbi:hypothetical protein TVAG_021310 [Trichomonas vaginalis G3]|uniref:Uncharacterized protein n=1 Tax=Trichomonas vaginalis (strain ATCC PRA-98 / G3) TaxID=412133 RepID=A2DHB3_TRIV3|nr:thioredoxin-like family [Trichomonas vaginalis G3]EAY20186.1 hypothetical protein TVAG_021310 [Trichomonas vaginalis G3]KAI5507665.1 thioredoxin-like family [Trichomonas vaginalis G3]|eukprot:XP_001581172.1 hypothetical protein [Trichomonas vaginalis G3]
MDFEIPKEINNLSPIDFTIKIINYEEFEFASMIPSIEEPYVAIFRGEKLIYLNSFENIRSGLLNLVLSLRYSRVKEKKQEQLNAINNYSYFVYYGHTIPMEYENMASVYRFRRKFYYVPSTETKLQFYYSPTNNLSTKSDYQTMTQFVEANSGNFRFTPGCVFAIVSDSYKPEFPDYINALDNQYQGHIYTTILSWNDFEPYRKIANVSRSETSYFLLKIGNNTMNVWMCPDEDVISKERILFFVNNGVTLDFNHLILNSTSIPGSLVKHTYNISNDIPGNYCSVLFANYYNSWSNTKVELTFYEVARKVRRKDVKFFGSMQGMKLFPWYVPDFDLFPSFAIWKPNDHRPFRYDKKISVDDVVKWINELCPE